MFFPFLFFLQLINAVSTLDRNALNAMHQQLMDLRGCKGHKQCNLEKGERRTNVIDDSFSSHSQTGTKVSSASFQGEKSETTSANTGILPPCCPAARITTTLITLTNSWNLCCCRNLGELYSLPRDASLPPTSLATIKRKHNRCNKAH